MCIFRFLKQLSLQSEQSHLATISRKLPGTCQSSHPTLSQPAEWNQMSIYNVSAHLTPTTDNHQDILETWMSWDMGTFCRMMIVSLSF